MSSTEEEVFCFQSAGRARYHQGNFTDAIAKFTNALELPNVPMTIQIGILDNRAVAQEMIGGTENLELALLDMRLMMAQLSAIQAEVYLRVGKTLQLLDQDRSALEIYTEGIKQVKPHIEGFKVMSDLFN